MVLINLCQRSNREIYQKRRQCAYTFFLVHLHYCINKEIKIRVSYHPLHQHCIIWVMNTRQNISSAVSKHVFWEFTIKVECTSAVIFLCDITKEKRKNLNYCIEEWHTSTPNDIFGDNYTSPYVFLLLDM